MGYADSIELFDAVLTQQQIILQKIENPRIEMKSDKSQLLLGHILSEITARTFAVYNWGIIASIFKTSSIYNSTTAPLREFDDSLVRCSCRHTTAANNALILLGPVDLKREECYV